MCREKWTNLTIEVFWFIIKFLLPPCEMKRKKLLANVFIHKSAMKDSQLFDYRHLN